MKNVFLFLIFISCINQKNEYLDVYIVKKGINYPIIIDCDAIRDKGLKNITINKIIKNQEFISILKLELNKLKPSNNEIDFDTKIHIIGNFSKRRDTICIGLKDVKINGKLMENSKNFIIFINQEFSNINNLSNL